MSEVCTGGVGIFLSLIANVPAWMLEDLKWLNALEPEMQLLRPAYCLRALLQGDGSLAVETAAPRNPVERRASRW